MTSTPSEAPAPDSRPQRDAVFTFSYETYQDAVYREMMRPPDRLLSTMMTIPEVRRLLVVNPYRSLPRAGLRALLQRGPDLVAPERQSLHTPLRLRRHDSIDVPTLVRQYRAYDRNVHRAATRADLVRPVVVTTNPVVAGFSPFAWAGPVTYFGRDDWLSYDARQQYWPAYAAAYDAIARSEIGVVAVSEQIIDRINPRGPTAVVPNGVEPSEWLTPQPQTPAWMADLPSPRAVYVGTIDTRVDVAGLHRFAVDRPDVHIVLVGPVPDPALVAGLRRLGNLTIHRPVGRAELVATVRNADLALVAHVRSHLTKAMSPLKVFEYLAAGVPVVSIDLPPIRDLSDRVLLVDTVSDFPEVIDNALSMGRLAESARHQFVHDNSWAARHRTVLDVVWRNSG